MGRGICYYCDRRLLNCDLVTITLEDQGITVQFCGVESCFGKLEKIGALVRTSKIPSFFHDDDDLIGDSNRPEDFRWKRTSKYYELPIYRNRKQISRLCARIDYLTEKIGKEKDIPNGEYFTDKRKN